MHSYRVNYYGLDVINIAGVDVLNTTLFIITLIVISLGLVCMEYIHTH